ncbi:Hypothetical protein R9X50_00214400 [Acrodontium crateriforme]|uniref:Folic acid synthesis protein FOL1 n=1 Tax=Acrodontium crateriforme TaxID=150365 RepID=A0AAQ3R3A0_9PEZI|nr:Hypothetical protein R9X50_00214400 [Acrodontium crateriforme]
MEKVISAAVQSPFICRHAFVKTNAGLFARRALCSDNHGQYRPGLLSRPNSIFETTKGHKLRLGPTTRPCIARCYGSTRTTSGADQFNEHSANDTDHTKLWSLPFDKLPRRIFVALGSNIGDRVDAIESACRAMEEDGRIRIVKTSQLYETKAMYVEDQGDFLNGVCEIATYLEPMELLDRLQEIEQDMGRVKLIDKGPRNIDLDILFYKRQSVKTERLTIPHPLILEREFVLRPLLDVYNEQMRPLSRKSPQAALSALQHDPTMKQYNVLASCLDPSHTLDPTRSTRLMSILNTTPDSFSDGGKNPPSDVAALQQTVISHIAAGASIIDVGGQSSRPNAEPITAEEEITRVLPAIKMIRSLPEAKNVAISVDTYRASVAKAAVEAGADIVNDISAGTMDPEMLRTVGRLGCSYIMMHMRGTPETMQSSENCDYPEGVVQTVNRELSKRMRMAEMSGIRAWRIIADPGVGFSKTPEQNAALLRHKWKTGGEIMGIRKRAPVLIGTSRKSFIGHFTGVQSPEQRVFGTAATITAAIEAGADIVRVHDVQEMGQVVKMADAIYRAEPAAKKARGPNRSKIAHSPHSPSKSIASDPSVECPDDNPKTRSLNSQLDEIRKMLVEVKQENQRILAYNVRNDGSFNRRRHDSLATPYRTDKSAEREKLKSGFADLESIMALHTDAESKSGSR